MVGRKEDDDDLMVWIAHGSSRAIHIVAKSASPKVDIITDITPIEEMKAVKNDVEAKVRRFYVYNIQLIFQFGLIFD